jgi:hypothetical protein
MAIGDQNGRKKPMEITLKETQQRPARKVYARPSSRKTKPNPISLPKREEQSGNV